MKKTIYIMQIAVILILVCQIGFGCDAKSQPSEIPLIMKTEGTPIIDKIAPNFTWTSIDGRQQSLKDLTGKPVIIVTWDLACPFCLETALPFLAENYDNYSKQGIMIITINDADSPKAIADFIRKNDYPFIVLKDENKPEYKFRSPYILKAGNPWIILIDKDGILKEKLPFAGLPSDPNNVNLFKDTINNFINPK